MCFALLRSRARVLALAAALAAGPASASGPPVTEGPFVGTLPCADCEGIRTELTLVRDSTGAPSRFLLRQTYLGKPRREAVFQSTGPWQEVRTGAAAPAGSRVRVDPYQPNWRQSFLRLGPTTLELLDRQEGRIKSQANLKLELAPSAAPAEPTATRMLLAGTLRGAGPEGLQLQPCGGGGTQRVIDVSPESMVTVVLTDLGLDRRALYVEVFGRIVDGTAQIDGLNRAGVEMRCPDAGASVRWQAQGNEPFWALRAEADRTTFAQLGEQPIAHPAIDPTWRWRGGSRDRARAHLFSQTESGRIEAVLEPRICRDTMADAAFGYRAEVTVDNAAARRSFRGCAYLGAGTAPP
jgi:copper homeostasis protein (lipoprotein)